MAAQTAAQRLKTKAVFFLPRMSHYDHGSFDLVRRCFPSLPLIETANAWMEVEEDKDQCLSDDLPASMPLVVKGFFQNSKNFPSFDTNAWPILPGESPKQRKAWAVHFRFGDYLVLSHYHVPLAKYYGYVFQTYVPKGSHLVLFSDSPQRLHPLEQELRTRGYTTEIYDNPDPLQTLHVFSSCSEGAICSNSTFAWWASYFLWKRWGKPSYFPDTWMLDQPTPKILDLPFTQSLHLHSIPESSRLASFSYLQ